MLGMRWAVTNVPISYYFTGCLNKALLPSSLNHRH